MKINYTKIILFTLIGCSLIFWFSVLIVFYASPRTMADFLNSMGNLRLSSNLYYKDYEKNGNIESCHKALTLRIQLDDSEKIVSYYEKLIEDKNYNDYMQNFKQNCEKSSLGILEKSIIFDEENYLFSKYINNEIKLGKENIFNISCSKLINNEVSLKKTGLYAMHLFTTDDKYIDNFKGNYEGQEKSALNIMQEYYDECINIFEQNKDKSDLISKSYLISLGNRIILVGQDINIVNKKIDNNYNQNIINDKLLEINNIIKGIL